MSKEKIIKKTYELRKQGYSFKQIHSKIQDLGPLPHFRTLRIWINQSRLGDPGGYNKPFLIPGKNKEEVQEVYIKQLASMGFSKKEILQELKTLIP